MPAIKTSTGVITFKPKPIFWGMKPICKEIAADNLTITKHILDKANIRFMLIAGTLLGAIREHDFITHDEDVDIAFLDDDRQRVLDVLPDLLSVGFSIARYDERGLLSIIRNDEYIDFYFFKPKPGNEVLRTCCGWLIPDKFLTRNTVIEFKGEQYNVPRDYTDLLKYHYGADWMTPTSWFDYGLPAWKIRILKVKALVKECLPKIIKTQLLKIAEKRQESISMRRINTFVANGGSLT